MNATQYEDLMQRVLDGAATAQEEQQLQTALAGNPQLRSRFEELQRLFRILEAVAEVEPPPGAMEEVLRQVRRHATGPGRSRSKPGLDQTLRAVWDVLRRRLSPQLGYAFATGTLAGVALILAFQSPPNPDFSVAAPGTLHWLQPLEREEIIDSARLEAPTFEARVRSGTLGGSFLIEIEATLRQAGSIDLAWDDAESAVIGFQRSGTSGELVLRSTGVRIQTEGENRYRLWLEAPPKAPVRLQLLVADTSREATLNTQTNP